MIGAEHGSGLALRAGAALVWKAAQFGGVKLIFLIRTLVVAALLSPDEFGLFAIATVAVGVLMSLTDLGMASAIVQRRDLEPGHYAGAWTINLARAAVIAAILFAAAPAIAALFAEPRAAGILAWLALRPVAEAAASARLAALTRELRYRQLAGVSLTTAGVDTIVAIALAPGIGVWALVAGTLAGAVAGTIASYVAAPWRPRFELRGRMVRPLIGFGRWIFVTGIVTMAASALTQWLIARELGAAQLGLYALAARLAFLPYEVASQVVGDVAFPLYAGLQHDRARVIRAFRSIAVGTAICLIPVYILLMALAPWMADDLLGSRWHGTGTLIQVLAFSGLVGLFGDLTAPLFRGLGHPQWTLSVEVQAALAAIASILVLVPRYGVAGAAWAWVVACAVSLVASYLLTRRLIPRPLHGAAVPILVVVAASLCGAGLILGLSRTLSGIGGLGMAALAGSAVIVALIWRCDRRFELGMRRDLTLAFPQLAGPARAVPGAAGSR